MQDRELYQQILGLRSPWSVAAIHLDVERRRVEVSVEHPEGTQFGCPECGCSLACYDHVPEREWRHLDTMQFQTILKARVPRVNCPEHGVKQTDVSWAEKGSHFTLLFERLAIDILLATQTVTGAMAILGTKWDQTWGIIQRAVARGQARKQPQPLPRVGINEKAFSKRHKYITLLYDLDRSTVEAISDGHDTQSGINCLSELSDEQLQSIEAIAMDMSPAYVGAAKQVIPLAEEKIVHDRFHVMQLATKAVDQVRRAAPRVAGAGDDRLSKTKYVWITARNTSRKNSRPCSMRRTICSSGPARPGRSRRCSGISRAGGCGLSHRLLPGVVPAGDPHPAGAAEAGGTDNAGGCGTW